MRSGLLTLIGLSGKTVSVILRIVIAYRYGCRVHSAVGFDCGGGFGGGGAGVR
ncbi:MAG: hypothetical protein QW304_06190 [Thermoproteota archaeon]